MTDETPTNPLERDGCWLCDGCGEVEAIRAGTGHSETVGCPVCVENDQGWYRRKAEMERDALAAHVEAIKSILGQGGEIEDRQGFCAWAVCPVQVAGWQEREPTASLARREAALLRWCLSKLSSGEPYSVVIGDIDQRAGELEHLAERRSKRS